MQASPLRAGPFIRCTIMEVLELGCHDNLLDFFSVMLFSATPGEALLICANGRLTNESMSALCLANCATKVPL